MDFFQIKPQKSFSLFYCTKCDYSTHNNDEFNIHEKNCDFQVNYNKLKPDQTIKYTYDDNIEIVGDINAGHENCGNPTPNSFKYINNLLCGSISDEKYCVDQEFELEKLVNKNQINFPKIGNSIGSSDNFQTSYISFNNSQNNNNENASIGQNNSLNLVTGFNNLNIFTPEENIKQNKLCVISPNDFRDRRDKKRKCIVCFKLKIGDMVKVFDCHDIVHLFCYNDNLYKFPCPSCNRTLQ